MKVKIGKYKSWLGPYQLAEKILFFVPQKKYEDDGEFHRNIVHKFGEWLAHGSIQKTPDVGEIKLFGEDRPKTWIYRFLIWLDNKKERKVQVKIHDYDIWNADETIAYVVLPILKKIREGTHGIPSVLDEDVPESIRSTADPKLTEEEKSAGHIDENYEARWEWVLDEMIFAFETKVGKLKDWEDQFYSGNCDFVLRKTEDGYYSLEKGPNDTFSIDENGRKMFVERIQNGFRLFGKYYESLWT